MSLDFSKLECVKALADRTIAACPACREQGHDKKGDHLVIWPDGKFGCVSNPEDGAHRSRIFALAGEKDEKPSPARTPARRRSSWPTIEAAAAITPPGFHLEAVYRYGNAAAVARYEPDEDGEKTFRQFSIDGSAWVTGAPPGKWPLFGPNSAQTQPASRPRRAFDASTAGWSLKSRRSHAHPTTRPSEAICRVIPTDPYLRSFWARNPPPARSWAEWLGF
jgi:hypothetical protein